MTAMAIVYVAYWPCDSTEVQQGAARYLVAWLLAASAVAVVSFGPVSRINAVIDVCAVSLAAWITLSLVWLADQANLRLGINELGWWFAIAALVITTRRVARHAEVSRTLMHLIVAVSVGVAVYGWHQWLIGFPRMVAEYQANPDATLAKLGIDATPGSAMRIIFENRLYDGGPTGTFALANSMAAMLVGGWVAMVGLLLGSWHGLSMIRRIGWIAGICIVGGMLLAARSRSAVLALVMLAGWIVLTQFTHRQRIVSAALLHRRKLLAAMAVLGAGVSAAAYGLRDTEWVQQAPASLAIRLHYWWACLKMVAQSPLFGAGPGQFKARYESFRAASSTEQISDPHQFLLQTLTSGGIPALALLLAMLGLLLLLWNRRPIAGRPHRGLAWQSHGSSGSHGSRVAIEQPGALSGAAIGLAGVWLLGTALGLMPVIEAALLATIFGAGFGLLISTSPARSVSSLTSPALSDAGPSDSLPVSSIAGFAAIAVGIDLLASGGMTVPGVSVMVITWMGIAVPVQMQTSQREADDEPVASQRSNVGLTLAAVLIGLVLVAWYGLGVAPLEKSKAQLNSFEAAWSQGRVELATQSLLRAAEADRWDPQPLLQLTVVCRTLAIAQPQSRQAWQNLWLNSEAKAIERAGPNPVVLRQLGDNWLVHFQRYGERASLLAAERYYSQAFALAPSHEAYAAQWADILSHLGDVRAAEMARKSLELSAAGGYYERSLNFTMILPAQHFGTSVSNQPVQRPAAEVLAPLLVATPPTR